MGLFLERVRSIVFETDQAHSLIAVFVSRALKSFRATDSKHICLLTRVSGVVRYSLVTLAKQRTQTKSVDRSMGAHLI